MSTFRAGKHSIGIYDLHKYINKQTDIYKHILTHTHLIITTGNPWSSRTRLSLRSKLKPPHAHSDTHIKHTHTRFANKISIWAWTDRPDKPISGNEMVMPPEKKKKKRINPLLAQRAIHLSLNQTTKWHSNPDTFQDSVRITASQNGIMHLNWGFCW